MKLSLLHNFFYFWSMKKKINVLIIASVLGLIALSIIQSYLINNTYKLTKETFIKETKQSISRFDNKIAFDTLFNKVFDHLVEKMSEYKLGNIEKSDLLIELSSIKKQVDAPYINAYQKEFKKRGIQNPLKFQKRLKFCLHCWIYKVNYFESPR